MRMDLDQRWDLPKDYLYWGFSRLEISVCSLAAGRGSRTLSTTARKIYSLKPTGAGPGKIWRLFSLWSTIYSMVA